MSDPLAALRTLCLDGATRAHDGRLRAELGAIGRQLDRPLQLAVAGAVSAGKSTLINAMLRRSVAPADAGECTRLVTWYEHGERDGVVLVECVDGTVHRLALVDGRLPADLGAAPERVLRLRVQLADPALRTVTIIDTPGVDTVSAENEDATRRLLFGDAAAEHAQALLYVLRYVQRFDADTLEEFRELSAACGMTAVNTAAVLTQIDRRGDDDDPWPTARRLVATASEALGGRVLDVAPVIGLLAETARSGALGPADVDALRELAALPPGRARRPAAGPRRVHDRGVRTRRPADPGGAG
ncbi:MAG: dynamin family protein, partial [Pseudonocardia sp.]|nr:dynamin family protein [Pseudonocardia sp.]